MQSVTVVLTDDLDGSEATETVRFALDGAWYEIDLNPGNAEKLREVLGEWIRVARRAKSAATRPGESGNRVRARRSKPDANPLNAAIRDWAREHGMEIGGHGRIPAHVRALYEVDQAKKE
jgi:hypothetical protein